MYISFDAKASSLSWWRLVSASAAGKNDLCNERRKGCRGRNSYGPNLLNIHIYGQILVDSFTYAYIHMYIYIYKYKVGFVAFSSRGI